jgi:hypothetical protein
MILGVAVLGLACGPVGGAVYRQAMSSSIKEAPEPREVTAISRAVVVNGVLLGDGQGFSYYIDRDTSWTSP